MYTYFHLQFIDEEMKGNAQLSNSHLLEICQVCVFVDAAGLYFLFDSFKFIKFKFNKFYVTF